MRKVKKDLQQVDAPIYRYWQALYMSFYRSRLYVDVAKRWRGIGILYLLLIISLASIPLSLRVMFDFNAYFNEQIISPIEHLPPLYVQNGETSFDKKMPYFIKNKTGDIVAIIDTTGTVTAITSEYPHLTVLITKDKLFFRPPKFQLFYNKSMEATGDSIYAQSLSKNSNEVFVGKDWIKSSGISKLKFMAEALVYPAMTSFIFVLYLIFMLVLGFLGQLLAWMIFNVKLTLKAAFRLFIVAATPQIFLFYLLMLTSIVFPGAGILYIALVVAYFSFAILSVRKESKGMVRA